MSGSRTFAPAVLLAAVLAGASVAGFPAAQAQQPQPPPANSDSAKPGKGQHVTIQIEVTAGEKNRPVDSASVYVRYPDPRKFKSDRLAEMNVKTSQEGKVKVPLVPKGKILIQVIAPGWKTFGKWFELTDDEQVFKIHLDNPPKWY
jgi:hypothetical protein